MPDDPIALAEGLADLLDIEFEALLAGDVDRVARLSEERLAVTDRLRISPPPGDTLKVLHRKITRNQGLLAAAARGIQAVRDRVAALRERQAGFQTYDAQGARHRVETGAHQVCRKA